MLPYRLLAIDLDGTLLGPSHAVAAPDRAALHRAHDAGLKIVLCTGRAYAETRHIVDQIGLDLDAAITVGGAVITDVRSGQTIWKREIDPDIARAGFDWFARQGFALLWLTDAGSRGFDGYAIDGPRRHPAFDRWVRGTPCVVHELPALPPDAEPPVRLTIVDDDESLFEIAERLATAFAGRLTNNILTAPEYRLRLIEVFAAGVNKWSAITALCDRWEIDRRQTVAIGDDVNDVDMVREAGLGIAMANAHPSVRAVARRHTASHTEGGVAAAIADLLSEGA
jgi:hypothetical protein